MKAEANIAAGHKPTPEQRRRAMQTALVLALAVVGIYATVVLKFMR